MKPNDKIIGGALSLLVLYGGGWMIAAGWLEDRIGRWAEARRADGMILTSRSVAVSGFPFRWRATIVQPRLIRLAPQPALRWQGPEIDLEWRPWRPREVSFTVSGTHIVSIGAIKETNSLRLSFARAKGDLIFDSTDRPSRFQLRLSTLTAWTAGGKEIAVDALVLNLAKPPASDPDTPPHQRPALTIDSRATGITLPKAVSTPLGPKIDSLALRATIRGRAPKALPRDALAAWARSGGTVQIDHLGLNWSQLGIEADGTMALDGALQPVGALTARLRGYQETLDAFFAAGLIDTGTTMVARFALRALAQGTGGAGKDEIKVPMSLQDRWLQVGPVRLFRLPPIRWARGRQLGAGWAPRTSLPGNAPVASPSR
jgi:hypothetical protein